MSKDIIEMAREAGLFTHKEVQPELERFHILARNATLDEIATKIDQMPFGDTAASFAVWIREQKT